MAEQTPNVRAVFDRALDLASPEEQAAYLETACAGAPEVRQEVEALLQAHRDAGSFLQAPPTGLTETCPGAGEAAGIVIGPYRLLQQIGEGGMGAVWLAEQQQPVRRQVALKLIRPGMDSHQVLARFEAERQALALMDHPSIAKVHDAGKTGEPGRPYFVMELVKGVPLTGYCDEHRLTPRQRLELFLPVCQAIQHAHQKGVIHRDLKPSNILVALYDDRPVPKVIDFGIAKSAAQPLTERTLVTGLGAVVGTLEYMSPEQAGLNQLDVDTRSDVYSLGILLYELLTGTTPLARRRIKESSLLEVLRIIREEEVVLPSAYLSASAELPSIAANRGVEPRKLCGLVKGELDWIVMKCLEKDRNRRYETANALTDDVRRYLADEPVQAGPPSAGYRLRKFVRRHRGPVIAASVVGVALVAGIVGTSWGLVKARLAEKDAVSAQQAEARRAEGETEARQEVQRRLGQIEQGNEILMSIFADLGPRGEEQEGRPLQAILGDRLVKAAERLQDEVVGDPLVVARLQVRLGEALLHLGRAEAAITLFEKARVARAAHLGADHIDTIHSLSNLARAYHDAGQVDRALPLYEQTLKVYQARLGPDDPETLTSMNNLARAYQHAGQLGRALPLYEETLNRRKAQFGADHPRTLLSMSNLALGYHEAGQLDRALPLYKETLRLRKDRLGADHHDTLTSMSNLAWGYQSAGQLDRALPLYEETLKVREAKLGADHPSTLESRNKLAAGYLAARQPAKALPLMEKTLALRRAKLGPAHPSTLTSLSNLAAGYHAAGQLDRALPLLEEALASWQAKLGAGHPDTLRARNNLAQCYQSLGQLGKALPHFQEAAAGMEKLRFRHERAGPIVNGLIGCHERLKQFDQAEAWRRKWLAVVKERSGADSLPYAGELAALASTLLAQQKWTDAQAVLRECLAIREKQEPEAWTTFNVRSLLGGALLGQKQYADAEPLLLAGYEGMKQREKLIPPQGRFRLTEALERLVQLYDAWDKKAQAAQWRQKLQAQQADNQTQRSKGK